MYVGRLFFRKDTGNFLHFYEMEGNIIIPTIEQDLDTIKVLNDYKKESVEVIELDCNDFETREKARTASSIRLDNGKLLFDFSEKLLEEMERQKTLEDEIRELKSRVENIEKTVMSQ